MSMVSSIGSRYSRRSSLTVSRRCLLASAAAGLGALAFRQDARAASGAEVLHVDFIKGVARRDGRNVALDSVVDGPLRFAGSDNVAALPQGLLCESAPSGDAIEVAADLAGFGWRPHPAIPSLTTTIERTGPHSATVRFQGSKSGLQVLILNGNEGLDVAKGGGVRFGATLRVVDGELPKELYWGLLQGAGRKSADILFTVAAYADRHGFIDRHFKRSPSRFTDLRLGLGFVATGPFDFALNIAGPQFSVDEDFRFLTTVLPDRNSVRNAAPYFESRTRQFEVSGLGPIVSGGVLYSETGSNPADHLVLGIDEQFRASLTLTRDGERMLHLVLGETVPLQPWHIRCKIDPGSGTVAADWCGRTVKTALPRMPDLSWVNLGFHGERCAETFITSVRLITGGEAAVLPVSSVASPSLYDDFEGRESLDFGLSPTGHRWTKSRPPQVGDFAIVRGDYVAVQTLDKPIATYLKSDFSALPKSMGALVSFHGKGAEAAVALISSSPGFPQAGGGGSGAVHNVFASDRAYYGIVKDGSLMQLGPSQDYPEPLDTGGKRYGIGWQLEGDMMTLLLPGGYFHRKPDPRWAKANDRELVYELYRATSSGLIPVIHAVSAS